MLKKPKPYKALLKMFKPDYAADSVLDIDFNYLYEQGVRAALIDLDGTVVSRGSYEVSSRLKNHLKNQPLKIYIATNRPKSRGLKDLRESLNASGVIHPIGIVGKPFPKYYSQAAHEHGLSTKELIMIGDRYIQDIYGANKAGLKTVVVRKLDKPVNFIDRAISYIERRHTDALTKKYQRLF